MLSGYKKRPVVLIDSVLLADPVPSVFIQVSADPIDDSGLSRILT